MESAFTGLVRKHRVLFKPNGSVTSHNTIIIVLLVFHQVLCFFFFPSIPSALLSLCLLRSLSPQLGLCLCLPMPQA